MTEAQRRSRDRRDTGARDRLLTAARRCLRERGLRGTSSRAITAAAGENLAAVTYYFGSKDELVAAALAAELGEWVEPVLAHLREPVDAAQRLLAAVAALGAAFDAQRDRVPALLEVFVQAARDPAAGAPIVAVWDEVHRELAAVVSELRAADAVAPWVDPDAMAALIVAVVAGTVVSEAVAPDGTHHAAIAAQFVSLLLHAGPDR